MLFLLYVYLMFIARKSSNLVTGLQKFPTSYKIKVKLEKKKRKEKKTVKTLECTK